MLDQGLADEPDIRPESVGLRTKAFLPALAVSSGYIPEYGSKGHVSTLHTGSAFEREER